MSHFIGRCHERIDTRINKVRELWISSKNENSKSFSYVSYFNLNEQIEYVDLVFEAFTKFEVFLSNVPVPKFKIGFLRNNRNIVKTWHPLLAYYLLSDAV